MANARIGFSLPAARTAEGAGFRALPPCALEKEISFHFHSVSRKEIKIYFQSMREALEKRRYASRLRASRKAHCKSQTSEKMRA
jgi:hypothetical protein